MAIAGIFFGSDTGNTENIAKMIQKLLGDDVAEVRDVAKCSNCLLYTSPSPRDS